MSDQGMAKIGKQFYSFREVAREVGEPTSTIRYWEQEFDGVSPRYSPGGTRRYRREDVDRLRLIRHLLKERKLTIQGAKEELTQRGSSLERRQEALDRLRVALESLRTLQSALATKPNEQISNDN